MLPLSVTVFNQIQYLLRNLNESNSDSVLHELCQYIGYGVEASILVLHSCLYYLNVYTNDLKSMQMEPVLASIFRYFLQKSNFSTVFSEALRSTEVCADFLESLCNALQFSASEKTGIGFSLSDSENQNLRICGKSFCMSQIEELCASRFSVDSTEQIQKILMFLRQTDSLSKHLGSFVQMLHTVQLKENNAFILEPLLSNELRESSFLRNLDLFNENNGDDFDALQAEMEKEINISDVMRQMGYGFTGNVSQCKNMLSLFSPLTESTIAKILGTISRAHADVDDNQNLFMMPNSSSPRTPPIGSSSVIPGTPFSSSLSIQQQHRQQNSLEDRQKGSSELPSYMKQVSTPNVQPAAVPSPDPASIQKSKSAVGASGTLVPSPGFTRPSRSTTSAKFGSAMNIETLVAVAEKIETPIEHRPFQVFVKNLKGSTTILFVVDCDRIADVKSRLVPIELIAHVRLVYSGRLLRDSMTVQYYNIARYSNLHLLIALRGGANKP